MKKLLFLLLILQLSISGFSQDSLNRPTLLLRPYLTNGIDLIRSDVLKQIYYTKSMYFYGGGIQILHPDISKFIPFVEFTNSNTNVVRTGNFLTDTLKMSIKKITAGLSADIWQKNMYYIMLQVGFNYSFIEESYYNLKKKAKGLRMGITLERKVIGNTRMFLGLMYDYQKINTDVFRDFDMLKLNFGYIF